MTKAELHELKQAWNAARTRWLKHCDSQESERLFLEYTAAKAKHDAAKIELRSQSRRGELGKDTSQ